MNVNKVLDVGKLSPTNNIINTKDSKASFEDIFKNALDQVNDLQLQADEYDRLFATGQVDNIHQVMIASEKAEIAMQFTLSIRNKILDAYKEIMRMQV